MTVDGLEARAHCNGRRVDLSWENPAGTAFTKIIRRQRNWAFDLTDAHDVVYQGAAITEWVDTGVVTPTVDLGLDVAAGSTTATLVSTTAGLTTGDVVRIEQLQGEYVSELLTLASPPAGTALTFTTPTQNAYVAALGGRVSKSSALLPQVFYYYTVFESADSSPDDADLTSDDKSRTIGLSIAELDSKTTFFDEQTPTRMRELDAVDAPSGSGGWLERTNTLLGCWLNLMRGWTDALSTLTDDDQVPWNVLSAKNYSLGIDPEGFSYDFEIPRRSSLALVNVYHRRGSCEGMVRAIRMFTKWEAECSEFGLGGCNEGPRPLATWDGVSKRTKNVDDSSVITTGNTFLEDTSQTWDVDLFKNGTLIGAIGDIACVETNTADTLTLKEVEKPWVLDGAAAAGATVIPLASTSGLYPRVTIQIEQEGSPLAAEIHEILSVQPGVSVTLQTPVVLSYASGDGVSIKKSMIRSELTGTGTWASGGGGTQVLTAANVHWLINQWVGYKVLAADNSLHDIVSNTSTTVVVSAGGTPTNGAFAIARGFTLGVSYAARDPHVGYQVHNGSPAFLFNPTFNLAQAGLRTDPYHRLWHGEYGTLTSAWGGGDVGLYITSDVAVHMGKGQSATGTVFTLDPSDVAPAVGGLVGKYLNPNQNQRVLFRIVDNDATTVTVESSVEELVVAGELYYILNARDARRFERISARLGSPQREFAHEDINVHVLFG